jgi:hypothetical protein
LRVYWLGLTQTVAAFCGDALIYEPTFKLNHRSHFGGNLKGSVGRCTETIKIAWPIVESGMVV